MNTPKITLYEKLSGNNKKTLFLRFYPPLRNPDTFKPQHSLGLGKFIHSDLKTQRIENKASYVYGTSVDKNGKPKPINNTLTQSQKRHNNQTLIDAHNICIEYQSRVNKGDYSFLSKKASKTDFLAFFKDFAESKKTSNKAQFISSLRQLTLFTNNSLLSKEIDFKFCERFMNYLLDNDKLKQNTKHAYFIKFKITLKEADRKGFVKKGIFKEIYKLNIKEADTNVNYLTLDELAKLKSTPCKNELYKQAALFSAATGLRKSDCTKISLDNIKKGNNGYFVDFAQQKTTGILHAPLNETALSILNSINKNGDKPFGKLAKRHWATQDKELKNWVKNAGISKKITFHCFRHSFAVALISSGIDIFTVSKMLGHKSISTTVKTYAKVMNKNKKKAVDEINF